MDWTDCFARCHCSHDLSSLRAPVNGTPNYRLATVVNAAMAVALKDLSNELLIFPMNRPTSTLVANIWGHEVMAFEFEIPYKERQEVVVVRQALNNALRAYTEDQNLVSASDTDMALVVTDVWYDNRKPMLHVDVAHVINDETAAYLRDLRKLNQPV